MRADMRELKLDNEIKQTKSAYERSSGRSQGRSEVMLSKLEAFIILEVYSPNNFV